MENLNNKQKIIIIVICIIMLVFVGYYVMQQMKEYEYLSEIDNTNISINEEINVVENKEIDEIAIHIIGCVENEGLILLKKGDRIADAIEVAGGATLDADLSKINLAYKLSDGQKIYIPSINDDEISQEEYVTKKSGDNINIENIENTEVSDMVNINTANQSELETLPGIGPSTALKIIEHREQNGKFEKIEDITNVKGIGDSKYEAIKDLIEV